MIEKYLKIIILAIFLTSLNGCVATKDNGKHKGWTKNTNNPHHPMTTNPGNGNKKRMAPTNQNASGNKAAKGNPNSAKANHSSKGKSDDKGNKKK